MGRSIVDRPRRVIDSTTRNGPSTTGLRGVRSGGERRVGGVIARTTTIKRDKSCGLGFNVHRGATPLPKENFTRECFLPFPFFLHFFFSFSIHFFSSFLYFLFFFFFHLLSEKLHKAPSFNIYAGCSKAAFYSSGARARIRRILSSGTRLASINFRARKLSRSCFLELGLNNCHPQKTGRTVTI